MKSVESDYFRQEKNPTSEQRLEALKDKLDSRDQDLEFDVIIFQAGKLGQKILLGTVNTRPAQEEC